MSYNVIENGRVLTIQDGTMPQYYIVATEADKPPNPSIGDICKVTATTKEYSCFVSNLWSLTNSPCKEVYHNHTGYANDDIANAYTSGLGASTAVAPHMHHLGSGDGVGDYGAWVFEIYANPTTEYFTFNAKLGPITNGNEGNRCTAIGISNVYIGGYVTSRPGCLFMHIMDDTWVISTYDGVSGQIYEQITSLVDGDNITIMGQKDRVLYFVNGVLVGNHTQYLPSMTLFPVAVCSVESASGSVQRLQNIDYMGIEVMK